MLNFEELRAHPHLILSCYRSPFAVLTSLSVISTLKNEAINFSINFNDQDFDLIILTSTKRINIGQRLPIKSIKSKDILENIIINEDIFCTCYKYSPSPYLIFSILKRNNKLNKENIWPTMVYFTYNSFYLFKTCDFCDILKQELINFANMFDIKYEITQSVPFFNSMTLIDILLADIDYCNTIKILQKNDINKLYLKLAQQGIAIKHAKENYMNLNLSTQRLLKKYLPMNERFSLLKDYASVTSIEFLFWVVYFIDQNMSFGDLITSFSPPKAFESLKKISDTCKKEYKNIRKIKNWRILVTQLKGEIYFYKLVFDSFFKIFSKDGKEFAMVIQSESKHLLITQKTTKWIDLKEFKEFLQGLNNL
ncbi:hypothetical protein CDIK_2319 [Cucumispora dikerogammari]|nr:hypothetical protein CDIK_2319 [Cucumispora dikerogammari]